MRDPNDTELVTFEGWTLRVRTPVTKPSRLLLLLHGFTDTDDKWFRDPGHFINVPTVANRA